jgi:hypothetical protein
MTADWKGLRRLSRTYITQSAQSPQSRFSFFKFTIEATNRRIETNYSASSAFSA